MRDDESALDQAAPDIRDAEGAFVAAFIEGVESAIAEGDRAALKRRIEPLHEADVGDLIEALDEADRPRLIELLGRDFDFTALTELDETARVRILGALKPWVVADGIRDLDSDDAVYILEDLDEDEKKSEAKRS